MEQAQPLGAMARLYNWAQGPILPSLLLFILFHKPSVKAQPYSYFSPFTKHFLYILSSFLPCLFLLESHVCPLHLSGEILL